MKIAIVNQPWTNLIPPMREADSIGIWSWEVGRRLAQRHDVLMYADRRNGQRQTDRYEGVELRRIATPVGRYWEAVTRRLTALYERWRPLFMSQFFSAPYILKVALDLARTDCEVVHVHNFSQFVPIIRRFNPGKKIVLHMNGEWLSQLPEGLVARRLRAADWVLGCSDYITNKVRSRFPRFAARCSTVYNGVDVTHYTPEGEKAARNGDERFQLLFVGRVSPEKGIHVLLEAFERVVGQRRDVRLKLAGPQSSLPYDYLVGLSDDPDVQALSEFYPGSYVEKLKARLSPAAAAHVEFAGPIDRDALVQHYRASDLLLNVSLSESFGMSLSEAMASGIPAIGTRKGGMPEVVAHGETGLILPANDVAGVADAIVSLLDDDERRKAMGRAGRRRVEALFSWDSVADSLLAQYQRLLS